MGEVFPLSIITVGLPLISVLANTTEVEPTVPLGPLAVKLISFLPESNCRFDIVELLETCKYVTPPTDIPLSVEPTRIVVTVVVSTDVDVTT